MLSFYPGSVFDLIKQISCIKLLPPKHNHAKGEGKKNMLQKLPNSPPPQKTNGPSLTASACVVTAHACALFRPLNFFAITLVFNHSALLHMFSFSESLLYQPLILLSVSFSLSDLTRG